MFEVLADKYKDNINWQHVNFYWADERCVPPDSDESNYGMTLRYLLCKINIPDENVHRVYGENDPVNEAVRYSNLLEKNLEKKNDLPSFDLILLGMGEDGHTASIFPDQMELLNSDKLCAVATHPESSQKRITLTGNVINNADRIYFLITGSNKAEVTKKILEKKNNYLKFPAAHIHNEEGILIWNISC